MMVVVELTYKKSLEEVNKFLDQHRLFLKKHYDAGIFVASGPKNPRDGGVIIAITDKTTTKDIVTNDPFYKNDIADYRYLCFEPNKYCDQIKSLLDY